MAARDFGLGWMLGSPRRPSIGAERAAHFAGHSGVFYEKKFCESQSSEKVLKKPHSKTSPGKYGLSLGLYSRSIHLCLSQAFEPLISI